MHGRAVQTDASVSVANYGGPLVDLHGRVIGVLVPLSPQAGGVDEESELAGVEFYDSGIGFAVPLENILANLDRWKQGEDLLPGKLGVGLAEGNAHFAPPRITTVWPGSPAAKAAWQPEDLILAVDGQPVLTQSQLRFQVVPRYAGDTLRVVISRGERQIETELTLAGELDSYRHAFLGILPARSVVDDGGLVVRRVWPASPAAQAGVEAGDRLVKIIEKELRSVNDALATLTTVHPGDTVDLTVVRGEQELELTAEVAELPVEILPELPATNLSNDNVPDEQNEQWQVESMKLPQFSQITNYLAPSVEIDSSPGLLLWLSEGNPAADEDFLRAWRSICRRDQLILLLAHPAQETGWSSEDVEYIGQLARSARARWKINSRRCAIGGNGKAGQLAFAQLFRQPGQFSGAIGIDAPLPRTVKIPPNRPNARLAVLAVESRNSTFAPLVRRDLQLLEQAGYPASWLQQPDEVDPQQPLDAITRDAVARWLDGLDRF